MQFRSVFWLKNIYSAKPEKTMLRAEKLSPLAVIFSNDWFVKINDNYDAHSETILSFYSAVEHLFYMITGRGRAYYCGACIWDIAGSWPMLKLMNFDFYDYQSGRKLEFLSADDFNSKLKLNSLKIACRGEEFERLKLIADIRP